MQKIITKSEWDMEFETIPFDNCFPPKTNYSDESGRVTYINDTLLNSGIFNKKNCLNDQKFKCIQNEIHSSFQVPWTAFSRSLEQFLFNLPSLFQIKKALVIGCGWGVASGFLASGIDIMVDHSNLNDPPTILFNLDIDNEVIRQAKNNLKSLSLNNLDSGFLVCDFQLPIFKDDLEFDLIFLDAEGSDDCGFKGKSIYNYLIKPLYPHLRKGGLLIAHDVRWAKKQIENYLNCARNPYYFSNSFEIRLDVQGIELSQK